MHALTSSMLPVSRRRRPTPAEERRRVAAHIRRAEDAARAASPAALDPLRRLVRALLLDELARYRRRGRFPKNRDFAEQVPYFVDADGTRCAMAHLLEVGGEGELVSRVARERNHAWVRELADEPRLLAWLAAAGLMVAEAAAIQPSYCETNSNCVCGGSFSYPGYAVPASGVLEGVVTQVTGSYTALVRIEQIHGQGGGLAIGETFTASTNAAVGTRVLAPIGAAGDAGVPTDAGPRPLEVVELDDAGVYTCQSQGVGPRPVSAELFVAAVTSSDCAGTLAEADPSWGASSCGGSGGGGCAASGAGSLDGVPSTLGILLAVVSVIVARRRRTARPRRSVRTG